METMVLYAKLGNESRRVINMWFEERARSFVKRASKGIFARTVDAEDVRNEFLTMAGELACRDRRSMERWLSMRAEIFINSAPKGIVKAGIDAKDVETEFKALAIEYINLIYGTANTD